MLCFRKQKIPGTMNQRVNINGKSQTEVLELLNNFQLALDNEKKLHDTLDHLLEGFQIIDFDYRYVYANNIVVTQSKFSRDELLGYTMMEKYPGIENTEMFKTLELCMTARIAKVFENEFTYPDGSSGWFQLSMQPTEGGLTILSEDISERKKTEKEKSENLKDVERALFMTSHELRQPITQIQGLIGLLKNFVGISDELDKIIEHMEEPADALDRHSRQVTGILHSMELKTRK